MRQLLICVFLSMFMCIFARGQATIKVACVGNSITYGMNISNREQNCYPAQLQKLLGGRYTVENYGVSSTTLVKNGDHPYWSTEQYKQALAGNPDIVIIDLGANDAKLINRAHLDDYERDYKELISSFRQLPSHPRVLLLLGMTSFLTDTASIWDSVITGRINPLIQKVAYDEAVEVIDMHSPFVDKESLFADKLHPDKEGATIMAETVYQVLEKKRDIGYNVFEGLGELKLTKSSYYGYECADFNLDGRSCKIVRPKAAAKGHPWIWRARFWGHEPQTEVALLQQGFCVVYCDVAELFGNQAAIGYWNDFYHLLQKAGLARKAALEGMSRGGVYVYNWALGNPDKVACIYADAPVLDLRSWPGGKGKGPGSKQDWEIFKKDYNLTDQSADHFSNSPLDNAVKIAKLGFPMLHVVGDADEVVPVDENTGLFEQKIKMAGGNITVIHKPGVRHHPHSLPNPTPIVDFILEATGQKIYAQRLGSVRLPAVLSNNMVLQQDSKVPLWGWSDSSGGCTSNCTNANQSCAVTIGPYTWPGTCKSNVCPTNQTLYYNCVAN